ncbi:MAG TPA: Hsp20/alpha crystallin family protein [Blastocatellia bacterium]|nr:Hsp20/alpha crystallin family protein [Blastocatellia bacterium]
MASGTALRRIDPFQEFLGIQDRMNQLFRGTFSDEQAMTGAWAPAVDIYESPQAIELTFEIPGVDKNDVKVNLENNQLTVTGERQLEHADRHEGYHRVERSYGSFVRSFSLPNTIDPNRINAEYQNGLLRLSLPKRPESQPRAIEVKIK